MNYHTGKLRKMASVYLRKGDNLLLLYRQGASIVSNMWIGSAGGHFENDELNDARACMLRELKEELQINEESLHNISLRYITLRYTDGEIRHNYYFFADLSDDVIHLPESCEGKTQWFNMEELSSIVMPFTARFVIDHYLTTGQFNDALYGGIADQHQVHFHKL